MQTSDIPSAKFTIPFANGASGTYKQIPIPTASQIGVTNGAASLTDGFPPLNFQSVASGGVPPRGKDVNGILYEISGWSRWQQAGGPIQYDAGFATAIGGYPDGAVLSSNPVGTFWVSTADNNTANPDTGGANWVALIPVVPAKATVPECVAGVDNDKYVTPLGLRGAIDAGPSSGLSLSQNGFYTMPGGLIINWGRFLIGPGPTTVGVSFSLPFPNACFSCDAGGGSATSNQTENIDVVSGTITLGGFVATLRVSQLLEGCFIAYGI